MPHTSINRVTLVGTLTSDPELRPLPTGDSVCRLRVACNGRRRNPEGGYESKPNFFSVSVFGAQSENVYRYLCKGRAVAVDGRLEWREWETTDQQKREAVTIVANDVQFLSPATRQDEQAAPGDIELDDMELLTATESIEDELQSVEAELGNPVEDDEAAASTVAQEPEMVGAGAGIEDGELLF